MSGPTEADASPDRLRALFPDVATALAEAPPLTEAPEAPPTERGEASEPALRGTGRVFQRPGSAHWWIAYYHRGKEIRESSESLDRRAAERLLKRRLAELGADRMGLKAFVAPSQERVTVGQLLDALAADYARRKVRSLAQVRAHLRPIRAAFGDWRALHVTPRAVDAYIKARQADGKADATVNREVQLLGQAFRLAVGRGELAVLPKFPRLREDNVREGFFERHEFEAVAGHLPDYLQDFARFAYLTGLRRGRLSDMRWTDVDRAGRVVWLHRGESRNKRGTKVPLEGELHEIIARRWAVREYQGTDGNPAASAYVFHRSGRPIGDIRKAWATACKAAGVAGRLFHDMRRSAVLNMIRAGVPEAVAMRISGHKTRAVFDRYNIASEKDLREAVTRTQAYLASLPMEAPKEDGLPAIPERTRTVHGQLKQKGVGAEAPTP